MDESIKFYEDIVGLSIVRRSGSPQGTELCFMGDGEPLIELVCAPGRKAPGNIEGISLGFECKSLDGMMELIAEKGLKVERGPFQPNPRIKFFFVKDPSGVSIQVVENM